MISKTNRDLADFKGKAAIIGCSGNNSFCDTKHLFHPSDENFYSIDISETQKPDSILNITETLPEVFKERFELTVLEHIDFTAYNEPIDTRTRSYNGKKGFQNILNMTKDDGFILFIGCPRQKEYRAELYKQKIKYIELDSDNECILIPKNQKLSIKEVKDKISKLEPSLFQSINNAAKFNKAKPKQLNFCEVNYDSLDTFENIIAQDRKLLSRNDNLLLQDFTKIYNALYIGQTSFFKGKQKFFDSLEDVKEYIKTNPNSRTATALKLAEKLPVVNVENKNLIYEIHQYSYQRSSTFSIFKRTTIKNIDDIVSSAQNENSRTAKIMNALKN